jgi:hypothetical protein
MPPILHTVMKYMLAHTSSIYSQFCETAHRNIIKHNTSLHHEGIQLFLHLRSLSEASARPNTSKLGGQVQQDEDCRLTTSSDIFRRDVPSDS